ncbi:MAG: hypothetical protein ACK56F_28105, partial [bacterium]
VSIAMEISSVKVPVLWCSSPSNALPHAVQKSGAKSSVVLARPSAMSLVKTLSVTTSARLSKTSAEYSSNKQPRPAWT